MRIQRRIRGQVIVVAGLILLLAPSTNADDADVVRRLQRQLQQFDETYRLRTPSDQPISERLFLDYGAILRFGLYGIDDPGSETHLLRQSDATLYLRAELDGAHRFYGRLNFQYNDWNTGDDFDGDGDDFEDPIGERFWYQFDLRGATMAKTGQRTNYNVNVKAGRQFVSWGSGMTLSNVLHAGRLDLELNEFGLTGLVGRTPSTRLVDFDGSRPRFDDDVDRVFFGGQLEYRGWASHRPYVFFLAQRDHNDDSAVFVSPVAMIPTTFEYDSNYVGVGSRGTLGANLFYRAEAVYEFGNGMSNSFDPATGLAVTQTREDINAAAGLVGLTYVFRDAWDTRLDTELIAGTGDDDRLDSSDTFGGNRPGTDDTAFNALGFVNTGFALAPDPSNLVSLKLGISTSPALFGGRDLRVGLNGFLFHKIDSDAPISVATDSEGFVGGELDLLLDWRITSDVNFNVRYGVFFPGEAMPTGEDDVRHFVYAGVTYAF